MKKTVLYLAGNMRGIPEFNFPKFFEFERRLINAGYEVINPARHDVENGLEWRGTTGDEDTEFLGFDVTEALDWDLTQILSRADGVAVIDDCDWESSTGTKFEIALAQHLHRPVGFASSWTRVDYTSKMGQWIEIGAFPCGFAAESRASKWLRAYRAHETTVDVVRNTDPSKSYIDVLPTGNVIPKEMVVEFGGLVLDELNARNMCEVSIGGEEVRTTSSTGGEKGVKLARYDLLPVDALRQVAEHYGKGAQKYSENNWRRGYEWSKSFAALQRHANQFWGGDDIDADTGSNHMAAVAFHALTLLTFYNEHPEFDDRYKA